jgi:hypothetical protein
MSEKPKVIPTKEQIDAANMSQQEMIDAANKTGEEIASQPFTVSPAEKAAAEEMLRRTQKQLKEREELLTKRGIEGAKEKERMLGERAKAAAASEVNTSIDYPPINQIEEKVQSTPNAQAYVEPVQKQVNAPYDLIPLPSQGLLYLHKKPSIKVAFLNASDENILTSPHLLESGEFLDILLERKIMEDGITHKDLHVGDRNAIMVWLRATAYGAMYPVQVRNPFNGDIIETEIDLTTLKTKPLGAKPDKNGLFDYTLPVSGKNIKFKLLTVGDVEEIDKQEEYELNELKKPYADTNTYSLEKQIVEIDGNRDLNYIREVISIMHIKDSRGLKKYVNEIESGLDMNIEVQIPGGGSFTTFLPININFFWPQL